MQVDGGLFQIAMPQQGLNDAEIGTCFEQMSGEAMAQRVGMQAFADACPLGGFATSMPNRFGVDRLISAVILPAGKEPDARFFSQPLPVLAQFVEQLGAEHHVAILASLAAAYVNHHALAVDVCNFQVRKFSTTQSSGIEHHQQGAMEGSARGIDQSRHFLLAEDRWQVKRLFRIRSIGATPGLLECLDVEKTQ